MKKKLAVAILSAIMIGSPLTTQASSSFFADVPANDWSYSAVNELIASGNVPGYNEPIPQGRIMSRVEMAMIVDEAQKNLSAFSASDKAVIERLGKEYFYDIKKLQLLNKIDAMDVDKIDKGETSGEGKTLFTTEETDKLKKLANRFEISGFAQIRHDHTIENTWTPGPAAIRDSSGKITGFQNGGKYPGYGDKTRSKPSTYTKIDLIAKYKINDY